MASNAATATTVIFIIMTIFISTSHAEIRLSKILSDSSGIIPLDEFAFTNNGRLELKVSKLSFSSSTTTTTDALDLSKLVFFLRKRGSWLQVKDMKHSKLACELDSNITERVYNLSSLAKHATSFEHVYLQSHADQYMFYFANCFPQNSVKVSMDVHSTMYNLNDKTNTRDYLYAGKTILPTVYFWLSLVYFTLSIGWVFVMYKNRLNVNGIQFIVLALVILKALSLIIEAQEMSYIKQTGTAHGWDAAFIIFNLLKGYILFVLLTLVGWSMFFKPYLNGEDKLVWMIVILLQFFANMFLICIKESSPFGGLDGENLVIWLVDAVGWYFVLFNFYISIVDYKEGARTHHYAAVIVQRLKHFARFFVGYICYIYLTRCIQVFGYYGGTSYKYIWTWVVAAEIVTLAFYVFTCYSFKPKEPRPKNQIFPVDDGVDLEAAPS